MKDSLTLAELAALDLPGLPDIRGLADREGWAERADRTRVRAGRGGGLEYSIELLPSQVRAVYTARSLGAIETPASAAAEPAAGTLSARALEGRDARLTILALADKYAASVRLPRVVADGQFADLYTTRKIDAPDWARSAVGTLSARTLGRWRGMVRAGAISRLGVDKGANRKGKGLLDTALGGQVRTFALACVLHQPHLSSHHVRGLVRDKFPDFDCPPVRTFQRALSLWKADNKVAILQVTNPDAFKSHYRASARGSNPVSRLNELWMIDASPADVLLKEGRHSIYLCIDIFSRRVVITVSKTPRASAVGLLIRKSILQWGVPERVKTDNGSDFKAKYTERLMTALGVEYEFSAPYSPEQKGHVERAIGTMQRDLMTLLPGFIGHSVTDRKAIESRKSFAERLGEKDDKVFCVDLTAPELQSYCDTWANERYAHRAHEGLQGRTPFAVAAAAPGAIRRVEERALDMLLAPVAGKDGLRAVTKSGIRIDGAYYMTPTVLPGQQVMVRMDGADAGKAFLFSADGAQYLGEAICPELAGVDPQKLIAQVKAAQKALLEEGMVDIRKSMKAIKPRDMIEATMRQAARDAGTLVDFPRRQEAHTTPALEAAADATNTAPQEPVQTEMFRASIETLQAEVERDLAGHQATVAEGSNITPLHGSATRAQRFKHALHLRAAIERCQEISTSESLWLAGYVASAEFSAMETMFTDFGEAALR